MIPIKLKLTKKKASTRALIKEIVEAVILKKNKVAFKGLQRLTRYQTPNPVIKSIILENGCVLEEPEGIKKAAALDFFLKLITTPLVRIRLLKI